MRRRQFITLLTGATVTWPLAGRAQQVRMPVIGFMSGRSPEDSAHLVAAFRQGLSDLDFTEGQNVGIEFRWARGHYDRLPAFAAELVERRVAVLAAVGGDVSSLAAKQATSTIPIVFGMGADPVRAGLVDSFNRPGGNATGYTILTNLIEPKRIGLLLELVPGLRLLGILLNPDTPPAARQLREIEDAAGKIGQRLFIAKAGNDFDLNAAFDFETPSTGRSARTSSTSGGMESATNLDAGRHERPHKLRGLAVRRRSRSMLPAIPCPHWQRLRW